MQIAFKNPKNLNPRARNPRTHSRRQIEQIETSIEKFGFLVPVLIDRENGIIAGDGRISVAINLDVSDIPTIRVDHLTQAQIRAYVMRP